MLSDFRGRQLADPRKLVDRGFRNTQKPGHVHDRQDLAISCKRRIPVERCGFGGGIIHDS